MNTPPWNELLDFAARSAAKRRAKALNRPGLRKEALLDLANVADDQWQVFDRRHQKNYSHWPSDGDLLNWRLWLRKIWEERDERDVTFALADWTDEARKNNWPAWIFDVRQPSVSPNYGVFSLSLAIALTEHLPKMAVCANPGCPQRYFLKARKSQRFCDRPGCAAYGQREHKRNWWKAHGKEWKEKREAKGRRGKKSTQR